MCGVFVIEIRGTVGENGGRCRVKIVEGRTDKRRRREMSEMVLLESEIEERV